MRMLERGLVRQTDRKEDRQLSQVLEMMEAGRGTDTQSIRDTEEIE